MAIHGTMIEKTQGGKHMFIQIDKGIYETLIRRGRLITAKYKISKYIFFSLSGYTDWFESLSDEDALLLTLDSLYE